MVHFFRLCYCSSGSSCTFSSLVNTKLFEMLLYEKKNSQASFRHTVSLPLFPQWPLHHLGMAVTPSLILRGYISSWHLSPFIACAGVSLALPKKRAHTHTHTDVDIHTSGKWGDSAWRGGGENAVVLLPVTNPQRGRLSRLSWRSGLDFSSTGTNITGFPTLPVTTLHVMKKEKSWGQVCCVTNLKEPFAVSVIKRK